MPLPIPIEHDMLAIEAAIIRRCKEVVPDWEVVPFPEESVLETLHPQGTIAVRFGTFVAPEPNGRQIDRTEYAFELNVVSRRLRPHSSGPGMYAVLGWLRSAFMGHSLFLPVEENTEPDQEGVFVQTHVALIDLVQVQEDVWQYMVAIQVVEPWVL